MPSDQNETGETDLQARLAQAEQEAEYVRTDLTRQITNLSLKLDAANQQLAADQGEMERLQEELARVQAEKVQLQEDQELYKQMGDGQQDAVQKLLERADQAQDHAGAATKQVRSYLLLTLIVLVIAVGAVGFAIYIVLKSTGVL